MRKTSADVVTYYVADHLGSIVQETGSTGAVTLNREYDPWGEPLQSASTSGFAFTGREWDSEIGSYYYRARYYRADQGRFLSEDPIGFSGGVNLLNYVANAPSRWLDPLGLCSQDGRRPETDQEKRLRELDEMADSAVDLILLAASLRDSFKGAKSLTQLTKHLSKLGEAQTTLAKLELALSKTIGPKAQKRILAAIDDLQKEIKGHIKEIKQKWPSQ